MSKERDLLFPGIPQPGGVWAEFGAGSGIFTEALYELVGPTAQIFAVDRDRKALQKNRNLFAGQHPEAQVTWLESDFTQPLDLPALDGLLFANSLHFVAFDAQPRVLRQASAFLKPGTGRLLVVEYEARRGNPWVPYPIDYENFEYLATETGLVNAHRLAIIPSTFMNEMYSALAMRP